MTRRIGTIEPAYFDQLYREREDPWGFETSAYEREKYAATLSLLRHKQYESALEVGCSIGVLTCQLAKRCGTLLAIDASDVALSVARTRGLDDTVRFERRMVPAQFPKGRYDLIVLSEVLYYLDINDLSTLAGQCSDALMPKGEIILCHWLGETDYPLSGEDASNRFATLVERRLPARVITHDQIYRLERLSF